MYNNLIAKKNGVENAFGTMDAQLKQRYDLIPNLVETVKNYMQHERGTLENLTALRSKAGRPNLPDDEKVKLDNQISKNLQGLMVQVENYPDLKASANFVNLQTTLNEVESQIAAARRTYNAVVTDFNNAIEMFPSSIIAGFMKLVRKQVFEISEGERQSPNVGKLFKS